MAQPLGESHKRFLQTIMVNGIIDGAKARALHRHCCETHGGKSSIAAYFSPGPHMKNGDYSLSTRCIMEMEPYIRMLYQDQVKVCHICHNVALQMCENPKCGIKIHTPCVARYFKGRIDPRCPACEDFWPLEIPEVYRPLSSQNESQSAGPHPHPQVYSSDPED